jgi:hypothetical protein
MLSLIMLGMAEKYITSNWLSKYLASVLQLQLDKLACAPFAAPGRLTLIRRIFGQFAFLQALLSCCARFVDAGPFVIPLMAIHYHGLHGRILVADNER